MTEKYGYLLLDNDCSIRVYQSFVKIFPIMLALRLMLSVTYHAQNYAGIIGWSLLAKQRLFLILLPGHFCQVITHTQTHTHARTMAVTV